MWRTQRGWNTNLPPGMRWISSSDYALVWNNRSTKWPPAAGRIDSSTGSWLKYFNKKHHICCFFWEGGFWKSEVSCLRKYYRRCRETSRVRWKHGLLFGQVSIVACLGLQTNWPGSAVFCVHLTSVFFIRGPIQMWILYQCSRLPSRVPSQIIPN